MDELVDSTEQWKQCKHWKKCSSCKKGIAFGVIYWVCSVSSCNKKRTGLLFCTVSCWDAHSPLMNHRESWAEERTAPTLREWTEILAREAEPVKRPRKAIEEPAPAKIPEKKATSVILRRKSTV